MRTNGNITYRTIITPAGENEHGETVPAITGWSNEIKCSIKANSDTRKGVYEDGNFRQASYVILIEAQQWDYKIRRVKLTRHTENLGEHDILNVEPLPSVGRIQILV